MLQPPSNILKRRPQPAALPPLPLFLFFLMALLSIPDGVIASSGGGPGFNVAQTAIEQREILVDGDTVSIRTARRTCSQYGMILSLAAVPMYLAGKSPSSFIPAQFQSLTLTKGVSLTDALLSALVCLYLVRMGQQLTFSRRGSDRACGPGEQRGREVGAGLAYILDLKRETERIDLSYGPGLGWLRSNKSPAETADRDPRY